MSQIVVDTDVASYIFNWHSLAQRYADVLHGSELILSFMSVAELRIGSISAGWGFGLNPGVEPAPPRSLSSNQRECAARENLWNVADTGEGDGTCCCQQSERNELGQKMYGSPGSRISTSVSISLIYSWLTT
jgi:hypothetical protein